MLRVREYGHAGPTVIVLHGGPGSPGFSGVSIGQIFHLPSTCSVSVMNCCGLNASCQVASGEPGSRPSAA